MQYLLCLFLLVRISSCIPFSGKAADVGVILDLNTTFGKICRTCISMAIEDFYSKHNYTTMIVPHFRNSRGRAVAAASAAIDLLKNTKVLAILGPQESSQADFVVDIGEDVRVPIISFATSPALSPKQSPYFIRSAWCSSSQAKAIAAIVKAFGWREVMFVYEESDYGRGLLPFLTEHLLYSNTLVSFQSVVSLHVNNSQIHEELAKLMSMPVRVFIVHMSPALSARFFQVAKEVGMMSNGYIWIVTDPLTSQLDSMDSDTIEAMQGVVGVKAYVPKSRELNDFTRRWSKRFHEENPDMDRTELNVFGVWAYDSITALAEAVERVGMMSPKFKKLGNEGVLTDLEGIGTSSTGPSLAQFIRNYRFKGLSGDFSITNGELETFAFEVVNVIGRGGNRVGFWTAEHGISKKLRPKNSSAVYSTKKESFGGILWPGQTTVMPKGWELPICGKKLKIGVPIRRGFTEFTKIERRYAETHVEASGFCIDVFKEVMRSLPYKVPYEFFTIEVPRGPSVSSNFSKIVDRQFNGDQKLDAVVGDVTITADRYEFVDFTFPYTESGVAAIVPIKGSKMKNAWIFMQPLTTGLWLTIGAFFIFTGFVVWALEHRVNKNFRGSPSQQVGMMFWFSFSTLVFAHREKVRSNLTRFVVIVWVFVVLVLTSSYTASLTSMLTVEQLQPSITDINDLIKSRDYVGFQHGSFVSDLLSKMSFDSSMFRYYSSFEEYDEALSKGSRNGGVGAIIDELPYIRLFLSKYCNKYTMIGPVHQTSGFGFVFPKGSPLVPEVSRAILKLKEDGILMKISRKWFGEGEGCNSSDETVVTSKSLNLDSFKGLFLIAGLSSSSALAIFISIFMHENWHIWSSTASFKQKVCGLARVFVQEKENLDTLSSKARIAAVSPAISISCDEEGMLSQDEGLSSMEFKSVQQE